MRMTNKRLIKAVCADSVGEAFLITALEKYCKEVIADDSDWGNRSLINQDLWKVVAQHNLNLMGVK